MALNALWPLIANARPAGVSSLTEICTSVGMKVVPGDPTAPVNDSGTKHLQPHCPLCSYGTDKLSAPPSAPWHVATTEATNCGPVVSIQPAEPRSDIRSPAHPRAPPVNS